MSPKLVLKVSQVPDWGRRAIRLSMALTFFTTIAITLWPVPEHLRAEWGDEVRQTCNWAGASCAVVAASPLIGKVAQLSYERTLGTLMGGMLGYLVYDFGVLQLSPRGSDVLMVVSAAAVGALSCYLAFKFSLDASMRLFVITFLIVVFGGGSHSALGVALLRTGGIITGVLLFMGLTVVILPKSATIEALREMKSGLKLLVELNTLVWTSKQEAEAALKAAADKARAAELAAANAANVATKAAGPAAAMGVTGGASWTAGNKTGMWRSVATALGTMFKSQPNGYSRIPDIDPELGTPGTPATVPPPPAAAAAAAAAAGVASTDVVGSNGGRGGGAHPRSYLTAALQSDSKKQGLPVTTLNDQQQQQQQAQQGVEASVSWQSFMEQYEERCEAVLTKVYQSMFKVKEHVQLAESELYVHHFCGHYMFLPMFFNNALCNWCFPNRWRLPAKALEEVSTSVRVIARLLWTVHLDFSQEGFDEVIQALPPAAGMSNLLLDLAARTSGCLGVLVEAFPNKEAVLVDHLKALEELVNRMLEISGDQHEGLIRDLAANFQPARPQRATSAGAPPRSPTLSQEQQQQQLARGQGNCSFFGSAPAQGRLGARPGAAAVAAAYGDGPAERSASTTLAAARLGVDLLSPRAEHHLQQQQQAPRQEVWFVTYHDHPEDDTAVVGVSSSFAVDGLGPPIPAESPELWSPAATSPAAADAGDTVPTTAPAPAPAAAMMSVASQPELIFDMAESPSAAAASAAAAAAAAGGGGQQSQQAASSSRGRTSAGAPAAAVGSMPFSRPSFARNESHRSSTGLGYSSSLVRSHFPPFVRAPTLKLNTPQHSMAQRSRLSQPGLAADQRVGLHEPQGQQQGLGLRRSVDLGYSPYSPSPVGQSGSGSVQQQQQEQQQQQRQVVTGDGETGGSHLSTSGISKAAAHARSWLRSVSAPDTAAAEAAAALLQEYQQQEQQQQQDEASAQQQQMAAAGPGLPVISSATGGVGGVGVDESDMALVLQALNDHDTMSFVKLTRWYSFQFLMMELLIEIHDLYHHIRQVLTTLPHGL